MHALVYSLRSLSEEKHQFVGGGTVRVTRADLTRALTEAGIQDQPKRLPDALAPRLKLIGRVSGKLAERREDPDPAHALTLKGAYVEARALADALKSGSSTDPVLVSEGWLASPKISAAYKLLRESACASLPSPDTFRDILSDIATERLTRSRP